MQRLLAIESSCDETAACVMGMDGRVYSNIIASQIKTHALYGGVVPEIASRQHVEALPAVVARAVEQAGCTLQEIDYFACTYGPGLSGALLRQLCQGAILCAGQAAFGHQPHGGPFDGQPCKLSAANAAVCMLIGVWRAHHAAVCGAVWAVSSAGGNA